MTGVVVKDPIERGREMAGRDGRRSQGQGVEGRMGKKKEGGEGGWGRARPPGVFRNAQWGGDWNGVGGLDERMDGGGESRKVDRKDSKSLN